MVSADIDELEVVLEILDRFPRLTRGQGQKEQVEVGQAARIEGVNGQVSDGAAEPRIAAAQALAGAGLTGDIRHLYARVLGAKPQNLAAAITRHADNANPFSAQHVDKKYKRGHRSRVRARPGVRASEAAGSRDPHAFGARTPIILPSVCAQTAIDNSGAPPPGAPPRGQQITPIQWVGLAALAVLFLYQAGVLGTAGGISGYLQDVLPRLIALLLAITVHEFSHGLVATWFGDTTPRRAGRLTLNPLRHLDPIGTIMILIRAPIGWGRPMPINPAEMRNSSLGWALSSLAGPVSNILTAAVVFVLVADMGFALQGSVANFVLQLVQINVFLAVFNLFPIPPLDGFGVVYGLAPRPLKIALLPLLRYGPLILLAVLFLPVTQTYLSAFLSGGANLVFRFLRVLASGAA